jgi:hypothetical protein
MRDLDYARKADRRFTARERSWWRRHLRKTVLAAVVTAVVAVVVVDRVNGNRVVRFYGQVVDEFGNGIADVHVGADVDSAELLNVFRSPQTTRDRRTHVTAVTDSSGRFEFHQLRAHSVSITGFRSNKWSILSAGRGAPSFFQYSRQTGPTRPPTHEAPQRYVVEFQRMP